MCSMQSPCSQFFRQFELPRCFQAEPTPERATPDLGKGKGSAKVQKTGERWEESVRGEFNEVWKDSSDFQVDKQCQPREGTRAHRQEASGLSGPKREVE